ncbi:cobyrinic acid a,c-diamide synthase [Leptospira tipperaryensis]|uniref:Cobyrinate a,c-diamide synthase n=1 Tax=Leptospira tipperaryensis TaxID=2564040 RepID=A0A1D7V3W8_9LEPT|nr:cobyrinate a,c-diamide synthase [Leptospira tipperaryensis]AOP36536.1 cobyrinic acid a,c-diamide synthase [Leptospira tipperaryensis]
MNDVALANITIPRIVIAGTGSGVGKTTIVLALTLAFQKRGLNVATFKCGPDYLDPTYHARVSEKTCHNLDGWLMGKESVLRTFYEATKNADIAIIEGVMGLFDGHSPNTEVGSTAEIAKWLQAPVIAVVDASGMARTIAAILKGLKEFDPDLNVAGTISNFIGSESHLKILKEASTEVSVLGGFPKHKEQAFPERHLGLYSASKENLSEDRFTFWGTLAESCLQLDRILTIANSAEKVMIRETKTESQPNRCKIGIALDAAFHFYYEENLRQLRDWGAELAFFSPIKDTRIPEVDGLYFGGGYPELYARDLSENESMLESIREFAYSEKPIYAECGGLMYLSDQITLVSNETFPMLGLISANVKMGEKLKALGYVEVAIEEKTVFGEAGLRFRGHQFRYSDLELHFPSETKTVYKIRKRRGNEVTEEGYCRGSILASYVHAHWASNPLLPKGFVDSCAKDRR